MKLTTEQLKKIIKEELEAIMTEEESEDWQKHPHRPFRIYKTEKIVPGKLILTLHGRKTDGAPRFRIELKFAQSGTLYYPPEPNFDKGAECFKECQKAVLGKSGEELAKLVMDKNKWPDRYEAEKLMRKGELKVEKSVQDLL